VCFGTAWAICAAILGVCFAGLGVAVRQDWLGILIDKRNKISLSHVQVVLWTWLLVSAMAAAVLVTGRIDFTMNPHLYALMGITIGSLSGTVIVKGTKAGQVPHEYFQTPTAPADLSPGVAGKSNPLAAPDRMGVLNAGPKGGHQWADMVKGDEYIDRHTVDIGKVQMLLFTLLAVGGYGLAVWHYGTGFTPGGKAFTFPDLSEAMVTLLGISHAGYLTTKATPKTPKATPGT